MADRNVVSVVREVAAAWSKDGVSRLSAALAYFAIFSLAPLLIIVIQIAALVLGGGNAAGHHSAARAAILGWLQHSLGAQATGAVSQIVDSMLKQQGQGIVAAIISWALLLFGALGLVGALRDSLDIVWQARSSETGIWAAVRSRAVSLVLIVVTAVFLIGTVALTTFLGGTAGTAGSQALGTVVSFAVCVLLFGAIFKFLPAAKVSWRDALVGAGVTALLFEIGQLLLAWYLGRASTASAYGAAGSLVVVLLWIYYSAQIVLIGAEFTKVYAARFGEKIATGETAAA